VKRKIALACALAFLAAFTASAQQTHEAKITIRVVDESGRPITNAPVSSSTIDSYRKGSAWWGDVPNYKEIIVLTDEHGVAEMVVPKTESSVTYGVRDFPGYYGGGGRYNFKESAAGRWQPWNPMVELILKAIENPVRMYALAVLAHKIPDQGKPVGFDLMIGDWVPPYGKGKVSDFIFQWDTVTTKTVTNSAPSWDGMRTWTQSFYDSQLAIHFSNEGDGIQLVAGDTSSALRLPRLAPADGYLPSFNEQAGIDQGTNLIKGMPPETFIKGHTDYNKDANYFFRVRTKKDAGGKIASALYGKIYGDFGENIGHGQINFTYYLNPEPNSRNMEFNTKSNLFKNLGSPEQAYWP
jgi:hypothetical protein